MPNEKTYWTPLVVWRSMEGVCKLEAGVYGGDATKRQVAEAVTIQHAQGAGLLNWQDEWQQVKLPHIELSITWPLSSRQPLRRNLAYWRGAALAWSQQQMVNMIVKKYMKWRKTFNNYEIE